VCDGSVYSTEEKNLERTAQRLSCPVHLVCLPCKMQTPESPSISLKTIIVSPLDSGIPPIIVFFVLSHM
jgi:hypothetical protein